MRDVEVCVVGAGPHALTVVSHLLTARPSLKDGIVVVDPSGQWLRTWREQFGRLEIGVLRSPMVHHPDVWPGSLARFTSDHALKRSHLPYDPPLTSVFDSFCSALVNQLDLDSMLCAASVGEIQTERHGYRVTTSSGSFHARQVVWAGNTAQPIVPEPLSKPFGTASIQHSSTIDLRNIPTLDGEHIVVVGGGLTAGHLVLGALKRSARVTLVTRRPIVERNFDVEPGWLGPRFLDGFDRQRNPERRLQMVLSARGGGSMPGWMCQRLESEIDFGRLAHVVGSIESGNLSDTGPLELCVSGQLLEADRCWLATGTRPHFCADAALAAHVNRQVDGIPVLRQDLRLGRRSMYLTGRLAAIELGPAAGNLWGARVAALRITHALTGFDLRDDALEEPLSRIRLGQKGRHK